MFGRLKKYISNSLKIECLLKQAEGAKMNISSNLKYTKTHEWVEIMEENRIRTGLSDFAQNSLGSLVYVNLPEEDDEVTAGEAYADVESVKAVSDVNSPATGMVSLINEEVLDAPELINEDPYGTWLVEISEISEMVELMDADAYEVFCREEE